MTTRTGGELAGLAVVITTAGERLGHLRDAVLYIPSGRITGFEALTVTVFVLSIGLIGNTLHSKSHLPFATIRNRQRQPDRFRPL